MAQKISPYQLRPYAGSADLPALATIYNASHAALGLPEKISPARLALQFTYPSGWIPLRDVFLVQAGPKICGWIRTSQTNTPEGVRLYEIELYLAPADLSYDLVARLLTAAEKRLQRQAAQVDQSEPQLFNLLVPDQNTVLRRVLEQKGYQQIRQNLEMVREPLTDLRPLGPLPAGLVERIVTDADLPAIWQTEQIAMADLWEHQVLTPEVYQRFVQMPLRDNHLFTVIWDGTQDVAHTLAFIDPEENQVNGYQRLSIWSTAVLPAYRHFSLGVYVLRRALEKARAAGMTSVSLATDPDYQSGVIDLYRFLRFTVVASQSRWRKPVFPTDTAAQASLGIAQSLFRGWPCPPK